MSHPGATRRGANIRRQLFNQLEPSAWQHDGLSPLNRFAVVAILVSVVVAILESEPKVVRGREDLFELLEQFFGTLFALEYAARVWTSTESGKYGRGLRGVLRYIVTPTAILDLLAITPLLFAAVGGEAYVFRLFRLLRVLRLAKLGRFSVAMASLGRAVSSRRYELIASVAFAAVLLIVTSTLLYLVEGEAQPENFGSIPRAMWWSIVTLTTVGYGDVYPQTVLGKVLAGVTAVTGIGLIAMPTGILAAAFSEAMRHQRRSETGAGKEDNRE